MVPGSDHHRDARSISRRQRRRILAAGVAVLAGIAVLAGGLATVRARGATDARCPWVTSSAPIDQRVEQLLSRMTLGDKISMVEGHGSANPYVFYTPAIPSLCIPAVGLEDGPAGVADGMTGVTQLPSGVALAATWDPALAGQYGAVIGAEQAAKGASADLGPTVNIDRDPRWGRSFEALSEDPYLNGVLDVPEIDGIQAQGVEDQVKHWDAYNQETYRNTPADNAIVDNRALHEIYMPSFYDAITKAGAASVMCAYSSVNGDPSCNSSYLETTVLRDEWDFQGFVMSDFGALHGTDGALTGTDQEQPEATYFGTALKAEVTKGTIPVSVLNTMVSRVLTEMFRFNLFSQPRTGSPRDTVTTPAHVGVSTEVARGRHDAAEEPVRHAAPARHRLGRRHRPGRRHVARLRGRRQRVRDPVLDGHPARRHPGAQSARDLHPGPARRHGAARHPAPLPVAGLPGERHARRRPLHGNADSARNRHLRAGDDEPVPLLHVRVPVGQWHQAHRQPRHAAGRTPTPRRSAWSPARPTRCPSAASPPSCCGPRHRTSRRGSAPRSPPPGRRGRRSWSCPTTPSPRQADRPSLNLPSAQDELISAVAAANPRTIVVINAGAPVAMPWLPKVAAVLDAWYPGQTSGTALASVLFGQTDPGGHLPVTFPASLRQVPASTTAQFPGNGTQALYSEGIDVGYRWYQAKGETPLFPFGYGLSYTSFRFSGLRVETPAVTGTQDARVSATITNTGGRTGSDVVQLYVSDPASTGEPPRQLEGFDKVTLAPGKSARLSFTVTPAQLSWWDDNANGWTQTPGTYGVDVGDSSALANLPLRGAFQVTATPGDRQVIVSAPSTVRAGQPSTVTVTLGAGGNQVLPGVRLALQLPQGWTSVPDGPAAFGAVAPGAAVTARFTVTPPSGAPNATAVVHATATLGAASRENGVTVTVTPAT